MLAIIKPFRYSRDGITALTASPGGDAYDVPEPLRAGLIAGGYLRESAAPLAHLAQPTTHPAVFDPITADIEAVRAFLVDRGAKPHHKSGEAKLREMALSMLSGG